jgi:hypothetical protein
LGLVVVLYNASSFIEFGTEFCSPALDCRTSFTIGSFSLRGSFALPPRFLLCTGRR